MRRFPFTLRLGSRVTRQIVDFFLQRATTDRSGGSSRRGRIGSFQAESLEERWLMSAVPFDFRAFLASTCYESLQVVDNEPPAELASRILGFDGDTSLYLGEAGGALGDVTPTGDSYLIYEEWGGTWCDAEKIPSDDGDLWPTGYAGADDDWMCWAAAASNVLAWTGWGQVGGMTTCDDIFEYFQDHWTDQGGLMEYGWDWWFDGTNDSQGWTGWSQVDVTGGGFYLGENFDSYHHASYSTSSAVSSIDTYLQNGWGVAIGIYTSGGGHAITVWGVSEDASGYTGIWVSDSDDSKTLSSAPDRLRYYEVEYSGGRWYLQNFYGSNSWYIGAVEALEQYANEQPTPPAPEEPTNEIHGVVFNDVNANRIQDANESGLAGQTVFVDANANGILDETDLHVDSTNVGRAINDLTTTTSTLAISGMAGTIADLNVTLDITHTYTSDLEVSLISPEGTRVLLFDGIGGSGDNFSGTTLDDEAAQSISTASAPFRGVFRPQGSLADFDGEAANGVWTLEIKDYYRYDQGTLNSWSIDVSTAESSTVTDANGNYAFTDLPDGDYRVAVVVDEDWHQTLPAAGYYDLRLSGGENAESNDFGLSQITATDLGVVDYVHLEGLNLRAGQHWYVFEAARDGYLTIAADGTLADTVSVTLYDENFEV
ncbi:MAG: proprotein convertase P-domain-containing protein, partial [Pirellulales bacterium]|nr:proprotein convertase P-domain-containing protein [Pirellulales bacterium]